MSDIQILDRHAAEEHNCESDSPSIDFSSLSTDLKRELRSDHAGETGAVSIYRGILAISRDPTVRAFAEHHLTTEQEHLAWFEAELPGPLKTRLSSACAAAGWLTGALPALFGPSAVFATIEAVETFVDAHYQAQIDALATTDQAALMAKLRSFQEEEIEHRDDAAERFHGKRSRALKCWTWLVGVGSKVGVKIARRI